MVSEQITERAVQDRLFLAMQSRCQLILPNYTPAGWHECDLWAVTRSGYAQEYEVKVTVSDFKADAKKIDRRYGRYVSGQWVKSDSRRKYDRLTAGDPMGPTMFWYVVPEGLLEGQELPRWAGLIEVEAGKYGTVILCRRQDGPRLHNTKVGDRIMAHARGICYWRFWTERRRLDRLLRDYQELYRGETHTLEADRSSPAQEDTK